MSLKKTIDKFPDKVALKRELERRECLASLYFFCHWLGYTEVNIDTHGPILHALEMPTRRKLFVYPRGSFKSSIISICYPIWLLLRDPNQRVFIDSELYSNSVKYLGLIKTHIESNDFINLWGDIRGDIWRDDSIVIKGRTKLYKEPSIMVGGVGTRKIGMHFSTIIGDDYNSPQNTNTLDAAQKVIDHFRYNLNILEPDGTYVLVGTRYSENDLLGYILREILDQKELSIGKM